MGVVNLEVAGILRRSVGLPLSLAYFSRLPVGEQFGGSMTAVVGKGEIGPLVRKVSVTLLAFVDGGIVGRCIAIDVGRIQIST